jgi:hypothetical protein
MKSTLKSELVRTSQTPSSRGRTLQFESLSYDIDIDLIHNGSNLVEEPLSNLSSSSTTSVADSNLIASATTSSQTYRWNVVVKTGMIFILGIVCALFGIGIHSLIFVLLNFRNERTTYLMYRGDWNDAFVNHVSLALLFALFAFIFVTFDLAAVGSGTNMINKVNLINSM